MKTIFEKKNPYGQHEYKLTVARDGQLAQFNSFVSGPRGGHEPIGSFVVTLAELKQIVAALEDKD